MSVLPSITVNELEKTVNSLITPGKGLLAADESTPTITKRFLTCDISCTEDSRRAYREMLLTTTGIQEYIAGVILYEETLTQQTSQGITFSDLLAQRGIVAGIKVDKGLVHLPGTLNESTTQGLDGLTERLQAYKKQGARFAKWRAVYAVSDRTPSEMILRANSAGLARYAALCQEQGIVPIVEPEVLIDGDHTLKQSWEVSEKVMQTVFFALSFYKVMLEYMILKPSMVIPGKHCSQFSQPEEIAQATLTVLRRTVPAAVPSINFLSGGQTPEQATQNLSAMHQAKIPLPWNISFSYARALQEPSLKAWAGKGENIQLAQQAFYERAKLNSLAVQGRWCDAMNK